VNLFKNNKKKEGNVGEISVVFAGNPNVGKSTLFNTLTGLHRHTGNWSGKTVDTAASKIRGARRYIAIDTPGTYSLLSHSPEEEIARDYICFGDGEITVVVCDSTMLSRSLALAIQIIEARGNVIVALNLTDEAERAGIAIDGARLSGFLGAPVIKTNARRASSAVGFQSCA
jgi:ferrous iron transport protein B